MRESDEQFLDRLRDELQQILGSPIEVVAIDVQRVNGRVSLAAACRTRIGPWMVEADGRTLLDAARSLLRRGAEDRIAIEFRALVAGA